MVYEKANSVGTEVLDAPAWLHKYIIGRKGSKIRELTQDMPKVTGEHLLHVYYCFIFIFGASNDNCFMDRSMLNLLIKIKSKLKAPRRMLLRLLKSSVLL